MSWDFSGVIREVGAGLVRVVFFGFCGEIRNVVFLEFSYVFFVG